MCSFDSDPHHQGHLSSQWRPLPQGKLNCNVDAAFAENRKIGAISAILRDSCGNVITGETLKIHASSSLVAEALAIREGLILARSCFIEDILLESDCLKVIDACRDRVLIPEVAVVRN